MSDVFNDNTPNKDTVVTPPAEEPTLEQLKAELAALRKAKEHADPFIDHLKRQINEMREEMEKMAKPEEILEEIKKLQTKNAEGDGSVTPKTIDPEEVSRLVEETVAKREAARKAEENVMKVDAEVRKQYGDKAKEFVAEKAAELGMTPAELGATAARSPEAFYRMVGLKVENKTPDTSPMKSSVNPDALSNGSVPVEGTWAWYQELRKKDPKLYRDPKTQQKMFADRMRLGDAFGLPK